MESVAEKVIKLGKILFYFLLSMRIMLLCIFVKLFKHCDDDIHCMSPMRDSTDPGMHVVSIRLPLVAECDNAPII